MPNKTIYVSENDLPLWNAAQRELGKSISSLFAQFLREKVRERVKEDKMDVFVHVRRSTQLGFPEHEGFAVMLAPVGPTGTGGAMEPHYARGGGQLVTLLMEIGLTNECAVRIESRLGQESSISELVRLPRSAANYAGPRKFKEGNLVRVACNTQHKARTGTVVGIGEVTRDMVGRVERYWIDFPGDTKGPYPYDDNDLEIVIPAAP